MKASSGPCERVLPTRRAMRRAQARDPALSQGRCYIRKSVPRRCEKLNDSNGFADVYDCCEMDQMSARVVNSILWADPELLRVT